MFIPEGYGHVVADISLTGDSERMAVTFGISLQGGPFVQTVADAISTELGDWLRPIMSSHYRYEGCDVAVKEAPGDPVHWLSTAGAGPGAEAATTLPQNNAWLFQKRSSSGGRKNRGRMFVPSVQESLVDNAGNVDASARAALTSGAQNFLAGLITVSMPMVILHTSPLDTPAAVVSLTCDEKIATQRRRLR